MMSKYLAIANVILYRSLFKMMQEQHIVNVNDGMDYYCSYDMNEL